MAICFSQKPPGCTWGSKAGQLAAGLPLPDAGLALDLVPPPQPCSWGQELFGQAGQGRAHSPSLAPPASLPRTAISGL